jgi:SsrA-binding protein
MPDAVHIVARNRRAGYDYELLEKIEAGLVLKGTEVKALREGRASLQEAYGKIRDGELWIINLDIPTYRNAGPFNHEPKRPRKLLLNRHQILRLAVKMDQRGLNLIPLQLYFKNGWAKVEMALARGKTKHDKRDSIRAKEAEREIRREGRMR